jgi:hypothetical protein
MIALAHAANHAIRRSIMGRSERVAAVTLDHRARTAILAAGGLDRLMSWRPSPDGLAAECRLARYREGVTLSDRIAAWRVLGRAGA